MHNIFNQFFVFRLLTFTKSLHFKITKSLYEIAMRDIKSGSLEEGNYQALTADMFPSEMPSFQAGASRISEASLPLRGNSNFFRQSSFEIRSRSTDSAEGSSGKSKGKVIPLASDGGFRGAGPSERPHYIDTSDIHKLQVHLS